MENLAYFFLIAFAIPFVSVTFLGILWLWEQWHYGDADAKIKHALRRPVVGFFYKHAINGCVFGIVLLVIGLIITTCHRIFLNF